MLSKKLLLYVVLVALAFGSPALAGDWGVRFSYNGGGYYCRDYGASYVYVDRSPVVYYNDYAPVVTYCDPPVVYDPPAVVYRSYGPRASVVYSDYPRYYGGGYYRGYAPSARVSGSFGHYRGYDRGGHYGGRVHYSHH